MTNRARRRRLFRTALVVAALAGGVVTWANRPDRPLPSDVTADRLELHKAARELVLVSHGVRVKTYRVALGRVSVGPKEREGDARTPEGRHVVDARNPRSHFYLALHVSYPDAADRARAEHRGVPPGGDVMIHGLRNGLGWLGRLHRLRDWTAGCIAVTDPEIEELWRAVPDGTPIDIER